MEESFDVIVVGAGGSGLAAACSAAQHGGRVLVLEKQPHVGGTTGIAVGSYTAAGTRWQSAAGIRDDHRAHAEDAAKFAEPAIEARNNGPLREFFLSESAETLEWIAGLGPRFVGPHPEPPNRVPRMHNVVPGAKAYIAALQLAVRKAGGTLLCDADVRHVRMEGGRARGVDALVAGRERSFLARRGVILAAGDYANNGPLIARHKGARFERIEGINPYATGDGQRLAAQAGAALRNMDVTYGPELRFVPSRRRPFQQWLPVRGPAAWLLGRIAPRLPGWVVRRMIKRLLVTWQHPENGLFDDGAILLNRLGRRFVDERCWPQREIAVAEQPDKLAYILLDRRLVERYSAWPHFISTAPDIAYAYVADYLRLRPDVAVQGPELADVARQRGLNPQAIADSVREFNRQLKERQLSRGQLEAGQLEEGQFEEGQLEKPQLEGCQPSQPSGARIVPGRQLEKPQLEGCQPFQQGRPLEGGPWVLLGPVKAYFTTTEGGAMVNQRLQVLDDEGQVVDGLYAVGQNGLAGMILWGHGLHIAWALTSGRLAGAAVMQGDPMPSNPATTQDGAER